MSNETKRDVVKRIIECYANEYCEHASDAGKQHFRYDSPNFLDEYDAALPDDLPVIPKAVSEEIKRHRDLSLYDEIGSLYAFSPSYSEWIDNNEDVFAEAWGRRIWRVEETGEIVKLEA